MSEQNLDPREGEIDFHLMLEVLLRRRVLIFGIVIGITVLATVMSLLLPRVYRGEAFFQFSNPQADSFISGESISYTGVSVPFYKNRSSQYLNPDKIMAFALRRGPGPIDTAVVAREFKDYETMSKWVVPVYSLAREDLRHLPQVNPDEPNSVIGLNLRFESDSPGTAMEYVRFLGDYVRDCLVYISLFNYVKSQLARVTSELARNENTIMGLSFDLTLNENKSKAIRALMLEFPGSADDKNNFGQVISVQDGGNLYLPPMTQLVGLESRKADLNLSLTRARRDREMLEVQNRYFSQCHRSMIERGEEGGALLDLLETVKADVFRDEDLDQEPVRIVLNDIMRELEAFRHTFSVQYRLVSVRASSLPVRPKKRIIVMAAFVLGLIGSSAGVLWAHWWKDRERTPRGR